MKKLGLILTMTAALFASGCLWSRMKVNDPDIAQRARNIRPGVTRGEEVPDILGAQPTMRMPGKKQRMLGYTYADTKSNGLMLVLFNFTRANTVADTLYVEVDSETDIVTRVHVPPKREIEWRFWPFGE